MKKFITAGLSLLLTCSVALSALCGCASKKNEAEENYTEVAATSVSYSSEGQYTTQLTGADFSGISKNDVKVYYTVFDEAGYQAALPPLDNLGEEITESNAHTGPDELQVVDELPTPETGVDMSDYYKRKEAQITNVTVAGPTMTVSFTDPDAGANFTDAYTVVVESKKIAGGVYVEFESHTLTLSAETKYVPSTAKDVRLTLFLDGEFNKNVTKDDIALQGSFEGMQIASLSAAGKNLTLQLTGNLKKDEVINTYSDGVIFVSADAIKNAREAISAKIPVETLSAYFVGEKLHRTGSSYTLPLVLIDCGVDISSLAAKNIQFYRMGESGEEAADDITATHVNKTGDDEVLLTLSINDAKDRNAAAKKLNGAIVKINEGENQFEFSANIAEASFYPVFDYVEKVGDKLQFTLELYAHSGTFSNDLSAANFAFGQGFEGGSDVSVELTSDTTAQLIFNIPANGQTVESLNVDGGVTIKAGGLKNMWGDATSENTSYIRSYTQDGLGKYTLMGSGDVEILKKVVGGFGNTAAGTVASLASGAASAGTAILTILDITGIMPNKTSQTLTLLKEVSETINSMHDELNRQTALMQNIQKAIYNSDLSSFDTQIANLNTLDTIVSGFLATAAADPSLGLTFPFTKEELATLQVKGTDSRFQYNNLTSEQDAALKKYTNDLVNAVKNAEKEGRAAYRGFEQAYIQLESTYRSVLVQLTKTNDQNPMAIFDKLCSHTFNFDTSAYGTRYAQRLNIANAVEKALDNIALYYGCDPTNPVFQSATASYNNFLKLINDDASKGAIGTFAVTKKPDPAWNVNKTAYCYTIGRNVVLTDYFVYQNKNDNKWYKSDVYRYGFHFYEDSATNYYTMSAFYTSRDHCGTANFSKNFGDDEIQEFVRRMNGRTLREELTVAGFTGKLTADGMLFKCWKKNDGGYRWMEVRHATSYYCTGIKLDKKEPEQILRAQEDGGSFYYEISKSFNHEYCAPGFWLSL